MRDPILDRLTSFRGGTKRIARACGITTQAVSQWRAIPEKYREAIAAAFDMDPRDLAPGNDRAA